MICTLYRQHQPFNTFTLSIINSWFSEFNIGTLNYTQFLNFVQHANDEQIMDVGTYTDQQTGTSTYYKFIIDVVLCTRVWMPRDGESDEDGCRKDQRSKTHRRDGSASKIDHLRSPNQHDCNKLQQESVSTRAIPVVRFFWKTRWAES